MDELEFLYNIYKKAFFAREGKHMSLPKLTKRIEELDNNSFDINRALLEGTCAKFAPLLNDPRPEIQRLKGILEKTIKKLANKDLKLAKAITPDMNVFDMFDENETYRYITNNDLYSFYANSYVPKYIKQGIGELVNTSPEKDYPRAREIKRHFVLHIGPTNSGKTYDSLEKLKTCKKGIYLGPLRLLALEVYDKFNLANVPCNMITGEEELLISDAVCQASTIEMLNINEYYDLAVIDEAQMISDPHRGYNWTKAILGICASEIHVCMAPMAKEIVEKLIKICGDTYEIHYHTRMTPLQFDNTNFNFENLHKILQPGDALIVFSKRSVLAVASALEKKNIKASVIYGNLPPDARKEQVELFSTGKTNIVISTDAIGMGLNLPIRRVVFLETSKFDGIQVRKLNSQEIKQIAGRAGRKGLYDKGYCLAIEDRQYIRKCLETSDADIDFAPLGFPETLLELPFEINHILQTWSLIEPDKPFVKMHVDTLLELYTHFKSIGKNFANQFEKEEIYNFLTCPLDIKDKMVLDDWKYYCKTYKHFDKYEVPNFVGDESDLNDLETDYKRLDLYFQFSRKTKKQIDTQLLGQRKKDTVYKINNILKESYTGFDKKCKCCGRNLPLGHKFNICQKCFKSRRYFY